MEEMKTQETEVRNYWMGEMLIHKRERALNLGLLGCSEIELLDW